MKRTISPLHTDAMREIRKTLSRFLSLLLLSALAVAFLAGLRTTAPAMRYTADSYFDRTGLMDVRILSTLGLTEEDIGLLAETPGVEAAEGASYVDATLHSKNNDLIVRFHSLSEAGINLPEVVEGRLPEKAEECAVEPGLLTAGGFQIGDTLMLDMAGTDYEDTLQRESYTIVGTVTSPLYMSRDRGSSTIGTGRLSAVAFLPREAFQMEYYTEAYLLAQGAKELLCYSDAYEETIDALLEALEPIGNQRASHRYEQVVGEATGKLDDAQKEFDDAKAQAEKELQKAQEELADARKKLDDGWTDYREGQQTLKQETANAMQEIADAEQELADALIELQDGESAYEDGLKTYEEGKADYEQGLAQYREGRMEYEGGLRQLQEGEKEYEENLQKLKDGQAQYDEGLAGYQQGIQDYESGMMASQAAQKQLEEAAAALSAGQQLLQQSQEQYQQGLSQYEAGLAAYEAALADYLPGQQQYEEELEAFNAKKLLLQDGLEDTRELLIASRPEDAEALRALSYDALVSAIESDPGFLAANPQLGGLATSWRELPAAEQQLEAAREQLDAGKAQLDQTKAALDATKLSLDAAAGQLSAASAELAARQKQYDEGKLAYDNGLIALGQAEQTLAQAKTELEKSAAELKEGWAQLAQGRLDLDDGWSQILRAKEELADAHQQLQEARQELQEGKAQLEDARQELDDGWEEYRDGMAQLQEARQELPQEIAKGEQELEDARRELEDGEAEYADGLAEYEKAKAQADEELSDARRQLNDARREIAEIEDCKWYILERNTNMGYVSYDQDAQRMGNLAQVFPLIFFLVAALVCLTTMTRMVEEQRVQIGGLKALGYGRAEIAQKYVGYGFLASFGGGIIGLAVGCTLIPTIIFNAWKAMYTVGDLQLRLFPGISLLAIGAAVFCVAGTAWASSYAALTAVPAALMRPRAPEAGKRVLIERIGFLWRRLSFTWKVTMRNLFRYKKRFWMAVAGIGGCTALLITGFGLRDSIQGFFLTQYDEITTYDGTVSLKEHATGDEILEIGRELDRQELVRGWMTSSSIAITAEGKKRSADTYVYLCVVTDEERLNDFIHLRSRLTGEPVTLPDEGAVITEKLSEMLGVSVGDTVTIVGSDNGRTQVTIAGITENYVFHYLYLSRSAYLSLYGEEPQVNSILLQYVEDTQEASDALATALLPLSGVSSVSRTDALRQSVLRGLEGVDYAVVVVVAAAAALAFVVLYNLTNINITERLRELATLKVLGFNDREMSQYVYRENLFLTLFGILLGLVLGKWLHQWLVLTVEIDMAMFCRSAKPLSYGLSVILTAVFSLLVNMAAKRRLRKIDMVESLKTVE